MKFGVEPFENSRESFLESEKLERSIKSGKMLMVSKNAIRTMI